MTNEEAKAYFIDNNEKIISVAKDENNYNYETQQIEDVFMKRTFEANELAIKALELIPDNATNGDVIKALFPNGNQVACEPIIKYGIDNYAYEFSYEWWNAPYRKE